MPQPRIDMRVVRAGVAIIRSNFYEIERQFDEALTEMADELDDHADGANILVALTPRECEVIIERLKRAQTGYISEAGHATMRLSEVAAMDSALEELTSALRGVVVQPGV